MGTVEFRISSTGDRLVAAGFSSIERAAARAGRTAAKTGQDISRGFAAAHGWIAKLAAAAGLAGGAKKILEYKAALGELQVEARLSGTEIAALQARIEASANKYGKTNEAVTEMVAGMGSSREAIDYAKEGIDDLVAVLEALNIEGSQVGRWASTMRKIGVDPSDLKEAAGLLARIGQSGGAPLSKNFAAYTDVLRAGSGKYSGLRGVQQLGSLVAMSSRYGAPEDASLLLNKLAQRRGALKAAGINVGAAGAWNDIPTIMAGIMRKAGNDPQQLYGFFGKNSKLADVFIGSWDKKKRGWRQGSAIERYFGEGGGGAIHAGGASEIDLMARLRETGPGKEAEALEKLGARARNQLTSKGSAVAGFIGEHPGAAAGIALGGYGLLKLLPKLIGGKAGGIAGAVGAGGLPVFVTNMPGAGLGSGSNGSRLLPGAGAGAGLLATVALPAAIGMVVGALDAKKKREEALRVVAGGEKSLEQSVEAVRRAGGSAEYQGTAEEQAAKKALQQPLAFAQEASIKMLSDLIPAVRDLTKAVKQAPSVKVEPSKGLDSVDAKAGRGGTK